MNHQPQTVVLHAVLCKGNVVTIRFAPPDEKDEHAEMRFSLPTNQLARRLETELKNTDTITLQMVRAK
jgi:hypothetical protein